MSSRLRRTWIIGFCCCCFVVVDTWLRVTRVQHVCRLQMPPLILARMRNRMRRGPEIRRTSEFHVLRRILGPKLCPHKLAYGHTYASPTILVCLAKSYLLLSTRNQETHYVGYRNVSTSIANFIRARLEIHGTYALHELNRHASYAFLFDTSQMGKGNVYFTWKK